MKAVQWRKTWKTTYSRLQMTAILDISTANNLKKDDDATAPRGRGSRGAMNISGRKLPCDAADA
jgi:hypothetical protein